MSLPEELTARLVAGKLRRQAARLFVGKVDARQFMVNFSVAEDARSDQDTIRKITRRGKVAVAHSYSVVRMSQHIWWTVHYVVSTVPAVGVLHRTRRVKHHGDYFEIREERLPSGVLLQDCFYRNSNMVEAKLASRRYFP